MIGGFFVSRKVRTTIYIVGILWIAVVSQLLVGRLFMDDQRIMDAFNDTGTNIEESKFNLVMDYGNEYLLHDQKEAVLKEIADTVGVKQYETTTETTKNAVNLKAEEKGKNKNVTIELVTIEQPGDEMTTCQNFVLVEMKLRQDFSDVLKIKKSAEKYVRKKSIKDYQSIIKFAGTYQGQLTEKKIERNVNKLLSSLQAKKVDQIKSDNYYTIYAYTGLVDDYIKTNGKRININIAVTYNEDEDKTELCLATPVLNEDY